MVQTMMTYDAGGGGTLKLLQPISDIQTSIYQLIGQAYQLDNAHRTNRIADAVANHVCPDVETATEKFDAQAAAWQPKIDSLRERVNTEIHPYRNSGDAGWDLTQRAQQWTKNAEMFDAILTRLQTMQAAAQDWTGPAADQYKEQLGRQPKAVEGQKAAATEMANQVNALSSGHACLSTVAFGYMIQLEIDLKAGNASNVSGDQFFVRSAAAHTAGEAFLGKLKSLQFGSDFVYLEAQQKGSAVAQATGHVPKTPAVATH